MALTPLLSSILTGGQPDANGNISANNFIPSYTTTATAAGTTTLTVASTEIQRFTGATTQTVVLPVVTTLPKTGFGFWIINDSSDALTVNSSGGNLVQTVAAGARVWVFAILLTGTSAASWDTTYVPIAASISGLTTGQNVVAASATTIATDGVKRYVALLTQSSTNAPTATVLENSLGGTVVWSRNDPGNYNGILAAAFPIGKVSVVINNRRASPVSDSNLMYSLTIEHVDADTMQVFTAVQDVTGASVSFGDGLLNATTVKIEVYP